MAQPVTFAPVEQTLQAEDKTTRIARKNNAPVSGTSLLILLVSAVFFAAPWVAAVAFGFSRPGEGFTAAPIVETLSSSRATEALKNTLLLTVVTTVVMLVLLVPTIIYLNVKSQRLARIAELLSVLPLVVPAVALVNGASVFFRSFAPGALTSLWFLVPLYVINALPLCYRALDAGVKSLDLQTMFAASSSLGATTWQTLATAVIPNLRVAMLSATLLCIAMTFGEFAIASLMLQYTFPVFMVEASRTNPRGIAALSFVVMLITWALLSAISAFSRIQSKKTRKEK